ncbi:MAG: hypothetical protein GY765_38600 [bacterium]|nr:hypothetical protein [bacterium]
MKKYRWFLFLSASLILASVAIYSLQLLIFKNPKDTFFYFFQDLAFVPISVLLVTLVIDTLMKKREKNAMVDKMNMVVGIFFSEMGNGLLKLMAQLDGNACEIKALLRDQPEWTPGFLREVKKNIKAHVFKPLPHLEKLQALKEYLVTNRGCLMRMLENPNLLEHETFTDLLWAVSHLTEEFTFREELEKLSQDVLLHLANDVERAYGRVLREWISYIEHLQKEYAYMFKLAVKMHPFC